ncbi:MAG: hypothetical protein NC112_00865 [Oxalobacter formigenes]|nr:hypothetical protein [Oxalobacter formigenes]
MQPPSPYQINPENGNTPQTMPKEMPAATALSETSGSVEKPAEKTPAIDREAICKAINDAALLTYQIRKIPVTGYLESMFALAGFLTRNINPAMRDEIVANIIGMIHDRIGKIKAEGHYEDLARQICTFKMNAQTFDVFGQTVDSQDLEDLFPTTDTDIDRQFRFAETKLGNAGIGNAYLRQYCDLLNTLPHKIDIILFVSDTACMKALSIYAKEKFHELNDTYRRQTVRLNEREKKKYDSIVANGDAISELNFRLPETIAMPRKPDSPSYSDHLFVGNTGAAHIELNGWEKKVIEEERKTDGFVCWLRNPHRGSWALCLPYQMDGEIKPAYPDFLIIRKDDTGYIVMCWNCMIHQGRIIMEKPSGLPNPHRKIRGWEAFSLSE